jgi:hypothetical protein
MQVLRLTFDAHRAFRFPVPASNSLRGILGNNLWARADATYEQFFAPKLATGPSGLSDPPRPFVLRAAHLDGVAIAKAQRYVVDLHLFDLRTPWPEILADALRLSNQAWLVGLDLGAPFTLDLSATTVAHHARVEFLTPMEIKASGALATTPDFGILLARMRDRISTLAALYGDGPLDLDFAQFGRRAASVRMTACNTRTVEVQRTSKRTGQTHSLGGFVGDAHYEGDLTEFIPYLRAAAWTGVGRQTTWGKGVIQVSSD